MPKIKYIKVPTYTKPEKQRVVRNEPMILQERIKNLNEQINLLRKQRKFYQKQLREMGHTHIRSDYFNKPIFLYVLRLENGCWYIGSSRNVDKRFKTHQKGKGAAWTKRHKPLEIVETRPTGLTSDAEAALLEDELTLEYARMYGTDCVRGGGYCQTKPRWPAISSEPDVSWIA
jgi:predicted GIY-YIG superfamily endonuclease